MLINTFFVPANTTAMWGCGGVARFYSGFSIIFFHYAGSSVALKKYSFLFIAK